MAPGAAGELVATFPGGAQKRDADLVDRERVRLQRTRRLTRLEDLAAILHAIWSRLGQLDALVVQVPRSKRAAADPDVLHEAIGFKLGEYPLRPASRGVRSMELAQLFSR